jgi:hypothetical protein
MTTPEQRAAKRAYYAEHREQLVKAKREWYAANPETAREYSRRYRIRHGLHADRRISWSRWTPERVEQLRQMRAEGVTYVECAKALGCSKNACERACDRYGIPKRTIRINPEPSMPKHSAHRRETDRQSRMWAELLGGR